MSLIPCNECLVYPICRLKNSGEEIRCDQLRKLFSNHNGLYLWDDIEKLFPEASIVLWEIR